MALYTTGLPRAGVGRIGVEVRGRGEPLDPMGLATERINRGIPVAGDGITRMLDMDRVARMVPWGLEGAPTGRIT